MACGWENYVADVGAILGREPTDDDLSPKFGWLDVTDLESPPHCLDSKAIELGRELIYESHMRALGLEQSVILRIWEIVASYMHERFGLSRTSFYTGEGVGEERSLLGHRYHGGRLTLLGYVYFGFTEIVYRAAYFLSGPRRYPYA